LFPKQGNGAVLVRVALFRSASSAGCRFEATILRGVQADSLLDHWRYTNMKNKSSWHFQVSVNTQGGTPASRPADRHLFQTPVSASAGTVGLLLVSFCGIVAAQGDSPTQLRQFIDQQVGTINKLKVPATDAEIPLPRLPNGTVNPRYRTPTRSTVLTSPLWVQMTGS